MYIQLPINRKLHTRYIYNYMYIIIQIGLASLLRVLIRLYKFLSFWLHSFASNIPSFHSHLNNLNAMVVKGRARLPIGH